MIVFFSVKDGEGSEDGFDDDDSLSDWNLSKYTVCSTTKVRSSFLMVEKQRSAVILSCKTVPFMSFILLAQ